MLYINSIVIYIRYVLITPHDLVSDTIIQLRQTDRYFIDRKKVNPDLFVIEIEICTCIYNCTLGVRTVHVLALYINIILSLYTQIYIQLPNIKMD